MEHRAGKVKAIFTKSNGTKMCVIEDDNGVVSIHSMAMAQRLDEIEMEKIKFNIGDKVQKISGYKYPGIVVAIFLTTSKKLRIVVEADSDQFQGMLHIYNSEQLELRN